MADMNFEERCPCGNSIKLSGYERHIEPQVIAWHRIHDKHANAIAKAMADNTKWPLYYVPPISPTHWWQQGATFTFEGNPSGEPQKQS